MIAALMVSMTIAGLPVNVAAAKAEKCGVEREAVKVLSDGFNPQTPPEQVTIAELTAIPQPKFDNHAPRMEVERRIVQLDAEIVGYKLESDEDFHVVIRDGKLTMVIEFPNADCTKGAAKNAEASMAVARETFLSLVPKAPTPSYRVLPTPIPVHIVGIPFLDKHVPGHIPTGSASNGVEIHPCLSITHR